MTIPFGSAIQTAFAVRSITPPCVPVRRAINWAPGSPGARVSSTGLTWNGGAAGADPTSFGVCSGRGIGTSSTGAASFTAWAAEGGGAGAILGAQLPFPSTRNNPRPLIQTDARRAMSITLFRRFNTLDPKK